MYDDLEPELIVQADDSVDEYARIETSEKDTVPPLVERLYTWLETIDK